MKLIYNKEIQLELTHKYNLAWSLANCGRVGSNELFVPVCMIHADSKEELREQLHKDVENLINALED